MAIWQKRNKIDKICLVAVTPPSQFQFKKDKFDEEKSHLLSDSIELARLADQIVPPKWPITDLSVVVQAVVIRPYKSVLLVHIWVYLFQFFLFWCFKHKIRRLDSLSRRPTLAKQSFLPLKLPLKHDAILSVSLEDHPGSRGPYSQYLCCSFDGVSFLIHQSDYLQPRLIWDSLVFLWLPDQFWHTLFVPCQIIIFEIKMFCGLMWSKGIFFHYQI